MLACARLQHSPRALRTFTVLNTGEFEKLLVPFAQAWHAHVEAYQSQAPVRQRRVGGGRKARLLCLPRRGPF